jgi:hypothetical protein
MTADVLVPPLLMVLGGIVTWFIKSRVEELRATEARLSEERRKVYTEILEPYIRIFTDSSGKGAAAALKKMLSFEYRRTAFEFALFGSDDVIAAYNTLMKLTYEGEAPENRDTKKMLECFGALLLEIRKSLGNKKTKLKQLDMIRAMIKDIDSLQSGA